MEAAQPVLKGAFKKHLRRSQSEGSLFLDLPPDSPEQTLLSQELNVDETQGSFSKRRKLFLEPNAATKGLTVFRMLISTKDDDSIDCFKGQIFNLKSKYEKKNVEVNLLPVATGVGVVMVSAKRDSKCSSTHALNAFDEVHENYLQTMPYENCLTRLLVPASHAKKMIIFHTIFPDPYRLYVYLTDNMPVFFPGDVIVEVEGKRGEVRETIESIVSYLGDFEVDGRMMSELRAGKVLHSPFFEEVACGAYSGVKPRRKFMIKESTRIPLAYFDYFIGKKGEAIKKIWKSSPTASVYFDTFTAKEVYICIEGESDSDVEDAKDALEELIPMDRRIIDGKPVFEGMLCMEVGFDMAEAYDWSPPEEEEEDEF
ncbi:unnamed protein product [Cuscuta campestris]|uniref:K Homology domain-containing protein n=1 Tax=Cuscuta campestris TaxID=132261 RepID=A0A484LVR2_9ASTE|nr:unnamed protein product [Cuscuta campestris]